MSLLADPHLCPDCRAALDPTSTCTACGLVLRGDDAVLLWEHLVQADRLVTRLRSAAVTAPAPVPVAPAVAVAQPAPRPTAGLPTAPGVPGLPRAGGRGVSSLSVQVVLLGVGGLCLLVAAAVFVAVRWSDLGLTGRTLVLAAITSVVGYVAVVLTRRGLRGGAETLWLLTGAMVTIDLVAAHVAGMTGALDDRHLGGLVGAVALLGAIAVQAWASTTPTTRLHGMTATAAGGTLLLVAAEVWAAPRWTLATAVAVPVLLVAALLIRRTSPALVPVAYAVGGVGALNWLVLALVGLGRTGAEPAVWWQELRGWPLLVAAAWPALVALRRTFPDPLRYAAAAVTLVALTAFALGAPTGDDSEILLLAGAALALGAVSALAPRIWAHPAAGMAGTAVLAAVLATVLRPVAVISTLPTTGPARGANLDERLPATTWELGPWTAPVIAATGVAVALCLVRHLPVGHRPAAGRLVAVTGSVLLATGLAALVLEDRPELLPAVVVWSYLVALAAVLTVVVARDTPVALVGGLATLGYLVALGLRLAVPSHLLVALLATAVAVGLGVALTRTRTDRFGGALVPAYAVAGLFLAGFAATHWPYVAHATGDTAGLALVGVMAVATLGAAGLGRTEPGRVALELTALTGALVALPLPGDDEVVTLVVTIAGATIALVSVLHRDRDVLSWLATGVLAVATLLRIDQDVAVPELHALPVAAVLLAVGVHRLTRDAGLSSHRALGSGLVLALVPSLLLALDEPVSLRGALVAAAGVAALALGVVRRWGAPFLAGAAVTAVLAVRHLGPVAEALPRWISLGSVGVALLVVGITWEARRRDASAAERYLAALR